MKKFLALVVMALGVGLSALVVSSVSAQYPPPAARTVVAVASNITPSVGGTVSVAATVADNAGDAVAGVECTFAIASQPGTGASVDPGPVTTNSDGVASSLLHVGGTEGTIVVEATCGELSAAVTVVASTGEAPAAPPASLPDTGFGPRQEPGGLNGFLLAGLGMALAVAAGAIYRARRARL